ncbi:uncharacterized protein LOC116762926 [Phocoena sinus]|uniref:uncharacterized protein LOC116762926 n=1 Tax=Phocoena sinus TaxID=42100 RepID=UPI0013C4EEE8|nr:uncharacterized protein LOC116762926 [Phocoena sinus]
MWEPESRLWEPQGPCFAGGGVPLPHEAYSALGASPPFSPLSHFGDQTTDIPRRAQEKAHFRLVTFPGLGEVTICRRLPREQARLPLYAEAPAFSSAVVPAQRSPGKPEKPVGKPCVGRFRRQNGSRASPPRLAPHPPQMPAPRKRPGPRAPRPEPSGEAECRVGSVTAPRLLRLHPTICPAGLVGRPWLGLPRKRKQRRVVSRCAGGSSRGVSPRQRPRLGVFGAATRADQ